MPHEGNRFDADSAIGDAALAEAIAELAEAEARAREATARAQLARSRASRSRLIGSPAPQHQPDSGDTADGEDSKSDTASSTVGNSDDARVAVDRRQWLSRSILIVGVVLSCAVFIITGLMVRDHRQTTAHQAQDADFVAAARRGVEALLSIDYTKARADVQRVIDTSTGAFRSDFAENADDFVKTAVDSQSVSHGNVTAAAVESQTGSSAVVSVAATSQISNAQSGQQQPRAWRMSVTVTPDGGQLKISNVEFAP